ncbi:ABC transporter permease [Thalassotalea euphylliae]|uniref:ABC transporter permease n=1 Tax=Thalassotalea euphylliae TaxID=1655234 RepID=A0A3E0TPU2_9GAMM|nr:ABC transporter permease [Thalassotalea euphylliae]REL26518.1 ABC transporter permease [Thalassotalea euphylliae]
MFSYYLKLAAKSIKKNPLLSTLMVLAIALGIGASMTTVTVNYLMSANPIPEKSEQLFYVQVDSWDPHNAFNDSNGEPPNQITWTEANNLFNAQQASKQVVMAKSGGIIVPENQDINPFEAVIRLTTGDFFAMFNTPFLFGSGWQLASDQQRAQVIVLTKRINDKLFGGENSIGRTVLLAGQNYKVVGVLDAWQPMPKFYDVNNGAFDESEEVFIPFFLKETYELPNWGNTNCWKSPEGEGFKAFLQSECINYQMWVQLNSEQEQSDYLAFLNNYVSEQKALGRFPRPMNNQLLDVMGWMANQEVVEDDAKMMMWMSFMFLVVCLLNTIGLLLAKFMGKSSEIGLRRAIGASKRDIFIQHIIESATIGLLGGLLGLGLALFGLVGIETLYGDFVSNLVSLDWVMALTGIVIAIVASILAGLYPTWRACNVAPATQLSSQ